MEDTIIKNIFDNLYIKKEIGIYYMKILSVQYILLNSPTDTHDIFKRFVTDNAKSCGSTDFEGIQDLTQQLQTSFSTGIMKDFNIRELLTPIMQFSFTCCGIVWDLIKLQSELNEIEIEAEACKKTIDARGDNLRETKEKLGAKINWNVIQMRIEHLTERFGIPPHKLHDLVKNDMGNLSGYPSMCHASTVSTNMTENLTTYLSKKYPRKVNSDNDVINMILTGRDIRIDIAKVKPELSKRELSFIEKKRTEYANAQYSYDFFMTGSTKLPWVTGNMMSKLNDQHPYYLFAEELGRKMIVGPSGTMEAMLNVAEIFNVNIELFSLGCIAWMFSVKDHSLYELMIIVNKFLKEPFFVFTQDKIAASTNDLAQLRLFMNNALAAIQGGGRLQTRSSDKSKSVQLSVEGQGITTPERNTQSKPLTTKSETTTESKPQSLPLTTTSETAPESKTQSEPLNFEYTSLSLHVENPVNNSQNTVQFPENIIGTKTISDPMHLFCAEQRNCASDLNDIININAEKNRQNIPVVKIYLSKTDIPLTKKSNSKILHKYESMPTTRVSPPLTNTSVVQFTPGPANKDNSKITHSIALDPRKFFNGLGAV